MSDLTSTLRRAPHGFDLFQAISLLERAEATRRPVGTSLGLDEALRLVSQVDLAFAPSDIHAVADAERAGPPLALHSSAVSLAGAQGPLPLPFTELLIERRRQRDRSGLDFLDIFNQRVLGFLYRGRRKHHLGLNPDALDDAAPAPQLRALDALAGLGRAEGARGPQGQRAWLRHAGVQGPAPRSLASLLAVLRDRLSLPVSGRQFVGAWHPLSLEERARLATRRASGPGTTLGGGAALGARAWDQEAGIALGTPPLPAREFARLLPGGRAHGLMAWLVARHQQREMLVVLEPALAGSPATRLAAGPATTDDPDAATAADLPPRLGLSAWLSSPAPAPGQPARPGPAAQPPRFALTLGSRHGH